MATYLSNSFIADMPKLNQNNPAKRNNRLRTSSPKKQIKKAVRSNSRSQTDVSRLNQQGLALLQKGAALREVFHFLAEQLETFIPKTAAQICFFNPSNPWQAIGPGLPPRFVKKVQSFKLSEFQNIFLDASAPINKITSKNITIHPEWTTLREPLSRLNYRFCHTMPVTNSRGTLFGAVSLFSESKRQPNKEQIEFIEWAARIAFLIIEDQRKKQEIRKLKSRLSNEIEERTQKIREAIRQLQDEIVQRKIMERSLKTSNEKLQNLSNHLENVREEERTRISREIHDELGQMLTTLKMKLAILEEQSLDEGFPIQEDIQAMMSLVETTLQTVRRISTELRPGILDVLGLSEALEWQAQEFQEQTKIKIYSEIQRLPENLGRDISTACFRICQEALTNVARHAKAKNVTVSLKHEQGKLELIVRDNGKGITNEQLSRITSLGLIGMRERAQNLGGDLNIERATPNGTEVTFSFPLELAQ